MKTQVRQINIQSSSNAFYKEAFLCSICFYLFATAAVGQDIQFNETSRRLLSKHYSFNKSDFLTKPAFFGPHDSLYKADLSHSSFKKEVQFASVTFINEANFYISEFDSLARFDGAKFMNKAEFYAADFHNGAEFERSHFFNIVNFEVAKFNNFGSFYSCQFDSDVSFEGISTNHPEVLRTDDNGNPISVYNTSAREKTRYLNFSESKFKGLVNFNYAELPETLDFSHVTTLNEIDLTRCELNPVIGAKCRINLVGTDIEKFNLNYELFELFFYPKTTTEQKISVYEKLLKRFKDLGYEQSYRDLDIEFQNFINRHYGHSKFENWIKKYIINNFQRYWWNYGYNKEMVLVWSAILLLLYSIVNIRLVKHFNSKVYKIESTSFLTIKYASKNKLLMSIFNSFLYSSYLFIGLRLDPSKFVNPKWYETIYILFIYLTGLFCLAYILNIIIVK